MLHRPANYVIVLIWTLFAAWACGLAKAGEAVTLRCTGTRTVPTLALVNSPTSAEVVVDTNAGTIGVMGMVLPITNRKPVGLGFRGPATIPGYSAKGIAAGWFDQNGGFFFIKLLPPGQNPNVVTRKFYSRNKYHCERARALS